MNRLSSDDSYDKAKALLTKTDERCHMICILQSWAVGRKKLWVRIPPAMLCCFLETNTVLSTDSILENILV